MQHRILVVEDDPGIAARVVCGLKAASFMVELATNGRDGTRLALETHPDLLVLDLMLPEESGFSVLGKLRERSSAPILVLTARGRLEDRLRCFELGATDYMTKPFWVEELVARIKVHLHVRDKTPRRIVILKNAAIDLDDRSARVDGEPAGLTRQEFTILAFLIERSGLAVTRRQLAEEALDPDGKRDDRTVDSHVARIRKKLGPEAAGRIETVWGIGYRLHVEGEP